MSVYALQNVIPDQLTSACIWIINGLDGPPENVNAIVVGWTIHPELFKDNRPHLFTLWTVDSFQTTCCYNTLCGFVLANKSNIVPGSPIDQVSTYGGTQHDITLKVYKEKNSGNWWLYYGASGNYDKLIPVGYWPKSLFTGLAGYASDIHYGGDVSYVKGQHGPPMGSGHFADEGENKAASFTRIQEVDQYGQSLCAPLKLHRLLFHARLPQLRQPRPAVTAAPRPPADASPPPRPSSAPVAPRPPPAPPRPSPIACAPEPPCLYAPGRTYSRPLAATSHPVTPSLKPLSASSARSQPPSASSNSGHQHLHLQQCPAANTSICSDVQPARQRRGGHLTGTQRPEVALGRLLRAVRCINPVSTLQHLLHLQQCPAANSSICINFGINTRQQPFCRHQHRGISTVVINNRHQHPRQPPKIVINSPMIIIQRYAAAHLRIGAPAADPASTC
ncbi:hypothetical protein J5N97_029305 [Dioscorea zingiberensis]|uniref:Neprosin PEP catalytic domain-containing protein n=1 Tax=Dioscorea zingiberensis TaxID=325984 RepID=A0A9D5C1C9_9LILI|nr:hypothetical protein J5N97_029305 [Dioscorea zingiberensis]